MNNLQTVFKVRINFIKDPLHFTELSLNIMKIDEKNKENNDHLCN